MHYTFSTECIFNIRSLELPNGQSVHKTSFRSNVVLSRRDINKLYVHLGVNIDEERGRSLNTYANRCVCWGGGGGGVSQASSKFILQIYMQANKK